ncbi:hypothetical protein HPB49_001622 [Dermacentor silvarum]|uniref:Uncharacterized protein n=1 Tax=Dermacentor silvarum TaxID=543639 RepID=A0ACB8CNY8_DERSI|nr:hypothetical protein HPB49_001622 [Dermacentor silvarum]
MRVSQSTVSECVRRVAEAVVNAGTCNKWVHFPKTFEEKAALKEGFLRRGAIAGVMGCVDGSLIAIIAPKGERKPAFMCRKGYYALTAFSVPALLLETLLLHFPQAAHLFHHLLPELP